MSIRPAFKALRAAGFSLLLSVLLVACSGGDPVAPERYQATDGFIAQISANVAGDPTLSQVVDIDHSRLGHEAGSPMPPARVLLFSDPALETDLIQVNPLVALDLPLRLLAFESADSGGDQVIYNTFDYLASRYQLQGDAVDELSHRYQRAYDSALAGLAPATLAAFQNNAMQPDGIVTIESPFSFDETVTRVRAAIDAQDDTVHFGVVDFQANAKAQGIDLPHSFMILFGGPGPGGKAMAGSPTLGLDAFCQKFLIWEDEKGVIRLSFNDLLALARRQEADIHPALRVINFRLTRVFEEALQAKP